MYWSPEQQIWLDICAGARCSLCEAHLHGPSLRARQYCRSCAPTPATTPYQIRVDIDHHNGGWSLIFSSTEAPFFCYWLVNVSDDQLARIVDRASIAPTQRRDLPRHLNPWGRGGFYAHMTETQFRNLHNAWQADPRNGYEKLHNLHAGATMRMRV